MRLFAPFFCFVFSVGALAQSGSEIYLGELNLGKSGFSVSNFKNITNRVGYDNQPSFHPAKPILYFASFNAEGRSDIKSYQFKKNIIGQFTETTEREYSPTITPDGKFISCIIQRDNSAQDLGKYPVQGGAPEVIINNLTVGYHAWLNQTQLALFVLGEPNTLRLFNTSTKHDSILASNIGRALHKIPGKEKISFVDKSKAKWLIKAYSKSSIETIAETLPGREDLAWTPDGKIVMSDGRNLFYFDTKKPEGWKMFYSGSLEGITRIAIDPKGKRIAIVVAEKP